MEKVSIQNDELRIGENQNMHVKKVMLYTGPDGPGTSPPLEVTANDEQIYARPMNNGELIRDYTAIRGEVGVTIVVETEDDGLKYAVNIAHHKGRILVKGWEI